MAAWKELEGRLTHGLAAAAGVHVLSIYRSEPLPGWLQKPLTEAEQAAASQMPVLVLNVKGRRAAQALCVVQLGDLEQLVQGLHGAAQAVTDPPYPDPGDGTAPPDA